MASRVAKGGWSKLPKGWTEKSVESFWESLTSGAPKHKVTRCIKKMDGKVDDPGAFCAALADRVVGKQWRSSRSAALALVHEAATILEQPLRSSRTR